MVDVRKFTAIWEEESVLIVALMHGASAVHGRHMVIHWCRKKGNRLQTEKLKDETMASDADAMAWAGEFADRNGIEAIYVCNFDDVAC